MALRKLPLGLQVIDCGLRLQLPTQHLDRYNSQFNFQLHMTSFLSFIDNITSNSTDSSLK